MDKDAESIRALKEGVIPIYEPGLTELVVKNVAEGRLSFTTALFQSVLAVARPLKPEHQATTSIHNLDKSTFQQQKNIN